MKNNASEMLALRNLRKPIHLSLGHRKTKGKIMILTITIVDIENIKKSNTSEANHQENIRKIKTFEAKR